MRTFNYTKISENKWDSELLGLIAAIYKEAGKQELYLKQRPDELEKLVEIAKVQSTEASNAIEGIVTTSTRIRQLMGEKTTPRNRDEQEIAGYRDVLNIIHESFDAIPLTPNYILQLHKILYSHMNNPMAGRTKSVQNYISATYPDGHSEVLFTPLAPFETAEALDKICEEYNLPTVVLTEQNGVLHGSARSIDGVNVFEVLSSARDLLIDFGGHAQAAGVTLKKEK